MREAVQAATCEWVTPMLDGGLAPIARQNASASGTEIVSYLAEGFGVNTLAREGDAFQTWLRRHDESGSV